MKNIKDSIINFIVNKRYYILVLFTLIACLSLFLSTKVNINYDISVYLPETSETKIGKEIMDKNFSGVGSNLNLMFKNLDAGKKWEIKEEISNIEGVENVSYDASDDYNKDEYTLYLITILGDADSETATYVYNSILDKYADYEIYTSGNVSEWNKPVLQIGIIALAIASAMLILIIMCESYIEPFLFLYAIGLAVLINMGTNIMFASVSNITNSIVAILQLALSMDYSIMLMNRYSQEREKDNDKLSAMKKALLHATSSIASSSVTTIVGLLALVFMSFTIGKDLGFVLAKGVLLSLISIFLSLPALILLFDKAILKTKKKSLNISMKHIGKFVYTLRFPALGLFVLLFGISFFLKDGVNILYTGTENDEIAQIFSENNQIAIVYNNEKEEMVREAIKNLDDENITQKLAYFNTIGEALKYNEVNLKLEELGIDVSVDEYLLKLVYYNYYNKNNDNKMTINEFVNFVNSEILNNKDLAKNIDKKTKENIQLLANFSDPKKINKKRSADEISDLLGVEKSLVKDIFVLYNANNPTNKMRIDELYDFLNKSVLTDKKYASLISDEQRELIKHLAPFVEKEVINTPVDAKKLSIMLGINNDDVNNIMLLYYMNHENHINLTLKEFFMGVKIISANTSYLENVSIDALLDLEAFILNDNNINNTILDKEALKRVFYKINPALVDTVYKVSKIDDSTKFSPYEFINFVILNFSQNLDESAIANLKLLKTIIESSNKGIKYDASSVAIMFGLDKEKTLNLYALIASNNGYEFKLSPKETVAFILANNQILSKLDREQTEKLNFVSKIMEAVSSSKLYSANEAANLLGLGSDKVKLIYSLFNSKNIKMNINEFTTFILKDVVNDKTYSKHFKSDSKKQLEAINNIISKSLKKEKFSASKIYVMLSKLSSSLDEDLVQLVYLYNGSINDYNEDYKLTLEEFVKYLNTDILNDKMCDDLIDESLSTKIIDADNKIKDAKEMLVSDKYSRVILNTKYPYEGGYTFKFITYLQEKMDDNNIFIIGDSPMAFEMSKSFNEELNFITVLTMLAIFVVIALTFKSLIVPFILVFIIQCAVYITMSILSLTGSNVYFIALLIVQSILMGATIDYAIVYTTYYIEMRKKNLSIKEALIEAYNKSIHTILCSSSILVLVTLIVGCFASQIAAKICMTLSKGTFCAALLILFILPPILAIFDKVIIKKPRK